MGINVLFLIDLNLLVFSAHTRKYQMYSILYATNDQRQEKLPAHQNKWLSNWSSAVMTNDILLTSALVFRALKSAQSITKT